MRWNRSDRTEPTLGLSMPSGHTGPNGLPKLHMRLRPRRMPAMAALLLRLGLVERLSPSIGPPAGVVATWSSDVIWQKLPGLRSRSTSPRLVTHCRRHSRCPRNPPNASAFIRFRQRTPHSAAHHRHYVMIHSSRRHKLYWHGLSPATGVVISNTSRSKPQ